MVRRRRFGLSVVVLCLAAGRSQATTQAPVANDQADVWFLQHMVPYLRQTMVVASLTREQLGDPRLVRLRGRALDRAFVQAMTARARAGSRLAANEAGAGGLPEVRQFARQAGQWHRAAIDLGLAVNLSVRNLTEPTLVDRVAGLLERTGVAPASLTMEITESGVMTDPGVLHRHALGVAPHCVRLSVDDFGTGYSSLAYLKRLPVDKVKLDRSLVLNMTGDPDDAAIVRSTIELAHNLGPVPGRRGGGESGDPGTPR